MAKNLIGISGKIGSGKDTVGNMINYLISGEKASYFAWLNARKHYGIGEVDTYEIKKFAGKLKQIVSLLTGCTLQELESQEFKNKELIEEWNFVWDSSNQKAQSVSTANQDCVTEGWEWKPENFVQKYTYRMLLQHIGTDALRDRIHEDVWVNALFADYKNPAQYAIKNTGGYSNSETPFEYPNWIITDMRFPNELEAVEKMGGITIRINRDVLLDNDNQPIVPEKNYTDINVMKRLHPSETALDHAEFDYTIDNSGTIEYLLEQVRVILQKEKII